MRRRDDPSSVPTLRISGVAAPAALLGSLFMAAWGCAAGGADTNTSAGVGGGGQGGSGFFCGPGITACDGVCVDTTTDPENCGMCAKACAAGEVCVSGTCSLECPGGSTKCGTACVDTANDPMNCGMCGKACAAGEVCAAGDCALVCSGGTTLCGTDCVDTTLDPAHCGGCDMPCDPGEVCANSMCTSVCPAPLTDCNGVCVDTTSSDAHCGMCDDPCAAGHVCKNSMCELSCQQGLVDCNGVCTNTTFDPHNCAMCGHQCQADEACYNSVCVPILPSATSCLAILNSGGSVGDGLYTIDPDGPGGVAPFMVYCDMTAQGGGWTRCLDFVNTANEDINNNTWLDTCVDWTMASWTGTDLMVRLKGTDETSLYTATGTRQFPWTYDHVTGTSPNDMQYDITTHTQLVTLSNNDKLFISGKSATNGGCWGDMGNGYGIVIYPAAPNQYQNPKMLVMPYREQVGGNNKRGFGIGNAGWFVNNEISYSNGSSFDCCGVVTMPSQLGHFEFYVR